MTPTGRTTFCDMRAAPARWRSEHQASPFRHLSVGRVLVWLHARRRPDAPGHLSVTCH